MSHPTSIPNKSWLYVNGQPITTFDSFDPHLDRLYQAAQEDVAADFEVLDVAFLNPPDHHETARTADVNIETHV